MSQISDFPLSARFLRWYVSAMFRSYYSECVVVGRENIPTNCPIIFAPNHINALMDAIAVHSIAPKGLPIVFLARSDIFRNKYAAKLLQFLNMMPAFRMRDGIENLGKNNEIFERCVEVLHQNKALGIMPEGNQGEERKLRPFTKGIFRIAFATQQKYGTTPAVKIIPIGIDYGDLEKFGKHIIINIGKPIEVSDYINNFEENAALATNEIRDRLSADLSQLTLDVATEKNYQTFETAIEVANTEVLKALRLPNKTIYKFVARQKTAKLLLALEKEDPTKIAELEMFCADYRERLKRMNLKTWTLEQNPYESTSKILDFLILLGTFTIFIQGFLLNILAFKIPVVLRKVMKVEYPGFISSIQFVFAVFFTFPAFYILQTVLFCSILNVSWWVGLIFFVSQYVFGKWAFRWYREAKRYMGKIRYSKLEKRKSDDLQQAQTLRKKIIQLIMN
ncbi:MAG: 1-acyl-sn-glycerol-3-phosphate acyltransferase [Paludibacter sp.]